MELLRKWIASFLRVLFGPGKGESIVLYRVENRVLQFKMRFQRPPKFLLMNIDDYNVFMNEVEEGKRPIDPGEPMVIPPLLRWHEMDIIVSDCIDEPHVVGDAIQETIGR